MTVFETRSAEALAENHAEAFAAPWSAGEMEALLADGQVFALAAGGPAAGPIEGFILCRAVSGETEILTLAVRPSARRRGLGRALLQAAMARGGVLFLEVAADNEAALALYDAAGFIPVGRRLAYYARPGADRVDALILRCELNS